MLEHVFVGGGALVLGVLLGFALRDHLTDFVVRLLEWGGPA